MSRSTVFWSNRGQAVRLPKAVAFPDDRRVPARINYRRRAKKSSEQLTAPLGR